MLQPPGPSSRILALACLGLSLSCGQTPTQVLVRFDAEPVSARRARSLRVLVQSADGETQLDRTVRLEGDDAVALPTIVPVLPRGGDSSRTFRVEAKLLGGDGLVFSEKRAILGFVECERFTVDMLFDDACIGRLDCDPDSTCQNGRCVDARVPAGTREPADPRDAQPGMCGADGCWENPRPGYVFLNDVCIEERGGGFAVGLGGVVLRHEEGLWRSESSGVTGELHSVACWPGGEAVAVGRGGRIVERRGGGWTPVSGLAAGLDLQAVDGAGPEAVWAVGDGGVVLRRIDGRWERLEDLPTDGRDVWAIGRDEAWIAAAGRRLIRLDGATTEEVPGPAEAIAGYGFVGGTGASDLMVVASDADNPQVWRFDGSSWSLDLRHGLGIGAFDIGETGRGIAGGGRGTVFVRDETTLEWTSVGDVGGDRLTGAAIRDGEALVVGYSGKLARVTDLSLRVESVYLTSAALRDVVVDPADPAHAVAVGDGALLERVGEGIWRQRVVARGVEVLRPSLTAAWYGEALLVTVGAGGIVAESRDGHLWDAVSTPTGVDLHDVCGDGERIVAVGADGVILERTGRGAWALFDAPHPDGAQLAAVACPPDGDLWVGTAIGALWRHRDGVWSEEGFLGGEVVALEVPPGGGEPWAGTPDGVYARSGGAWTRRGPNATSRLTDFALDETGLAWAMADWARAPLAGGGWAQRGPGGMLAIAPTPDGGALAVGSSGRIYRLTPP